MAALDLIPRQWATSLINAIPPASAHAAQISNPLRDLSPEGRNILLALYALFEKELLPALDLLDRHLVSRLQVAQPDGTTKLGFYLVRSAQQHNNSHHHRHAANYEHVTYYEVRLQAWSCSCPAFTFSAFPASSNPTSTTTHETVAAYQHSSNPVSHLLVGGLTLGEDMPICKHLLACVLVENCSVFAHFVQEKHVSSEELAGWAAGWGD